MNIKNNMLSDVDAVILCGGLGKRLRSVSGETPKVMMEIDGVPLLGRIVNSLKEQGIKNVILCAGYKADVIEQYFKENDCGVMIKFSKEAEPLGTGGALKNAKSIFGSDIFLTLNGDSYCNVDLRAFCEFHLANNAAASVVVSEVLNKEDFGSIELGGNNRILSFREKSSGILSDKKMFVNAGVYCFSKKVFDFMPDENKFSLEYDLFPKLINNNFFAFLIKNRFYDIGTPERYKEAEKGLTERKIK